jgi:hypothetical protein
MFHDEFYPTPWRVATEMLLNVQIDYDHSILEPSAGKGDLLDFILAKIKKQNRRRHYDDLDIDAIESNPELQMILKGKEYRVVGSDFLRFDTFKRYDWIFMNPPFSNGDAHLMKALDLLQPGGTCICILNAETIDNPYSNLRGALLRKLEKWNADTTTRIENAFQGEGVEREADVTIAVIRVTRPDDIERPSVVLDGLKHDFLNVHEQRTKNAPCTALIFHDSIKQAVASFTFEVMAGMRLFDAWEELHPHMLPRIRRPDQEESRHLDKPLIEMPMSRNAYIQQIRLKYWEALFHNPEFVDQLTSNLRSDLHNSVQKMQHYDFSEENIAALQVELQSKTVAGVEATIIALFDKMAYDHRWYPECKTNVHYFDGWATNFHECFKVGQKVILPLHNIDTWKWNNSIRFQNLEKLIDMELCLDYLDGSKRDDTWTTEVLLSNARQCQRTSRIRLRHCEVTFYKKGTTHIRFYDPELIQKFNIFACRGKAWLPPCYGKKSYDDLTAKEKAVVDSFEGEQSYRAVCQRPDLFISAHSLVPQLNPPSA